MACAEKCGGHPDEDTEENHVRVQIVYDPPVHFQVLRAGYHLEVVPHRDQLKAKEREKGQEKDPKSAESPHPSCPGLLLAGYQSRNQKYAADEVADLQEQQRGKDDPS